MARRIRYTAGAKRGACYTKRGPGRRHRSGPVRPSIAALPEFGADRQGNPIAEQPDKYLHSHARAMRGLRRAMGGVDRALGELGYGRV